MKQGTSKTLRAQANARVTVVLRTQALVAMFIAVLCAPSLAYEFDPFPRIVTVEIELLLPAPSVLMKYDSPPVQSKLLLTVNPNHAVPRYSPELEPPSADHKEYIARMKAKLNFSKFGSEAMTDDYISWAKLLEYDPATSGATPVDGEYVPDWAFKKPNCAQNACISTEQARTVDGNQSIAWEHADAGPHGLRFRLQSGNNHGGRHLLNAIDLDLAVGVRILDEKLQYRIDGRYDGFPGIFIRIDGEIVHARNPFFNGESPEDAMSPAEHIFTSGGWIPMPTTMLVNKPKGQNETIQEDVLATVPEQVKSVLKRILSDFNVSKGVVTDFTRTVPIQALRMYQYTRNNGYTAAIALYCTAAEPVIEVYKTMSTVAGQYTAEQIITAMTAKLEEVKQAVFNAGCLTHMERPNDPTWALDMSAWRTFDWTTDVWDRFRLFILNRQDLSGARCPQDDWNVFHLEFPRDGALQDRPLRMSARNGCQNYQVRRRHIITDLNGPERCEITPILGIRGKDPGTKLAANDDMDALCHYLQGTTASTCPKFEPLTETFCKTRVNNWPQR